MAKKFLAKIIAKDIQGLKLISACCFESKLNIKDIKYLKLNKIFLISIERFKKETDENDQKINSICKFEFVDNVKSKNIDQNSLDLQLELIAIDIFKKDKKFEINLLFSNKAYITLSTEIIEVTLEDRTN